MECLSQKKRKRFSNLHVPRGGIRVHLGIQFACGSGVMNIVAAVVSQLFIELGQQYRQDSRCRTSISDIP